MPIIVVEGVDGSGKTTLLDKLRLSNGPRRYYNLIRHSCRPLKPNDVYDFLTWIEERAMAGTPHRIVDRHPLISEPIYGPILRGEDLTNFTKSYRLARLKMSVDKVIYCCPPLETIKKNLSVQPQLEGVARRIEELVAAYDDAMRELTANKVTVIYYDYTAEDATTDFDGMFFS